MKQCPSPNYDARAHGKAVAYVVLHYTGMKSAAEALSRMCDPAAKVSAHYMIDEDGGTTQLIDEKNRAWHAGQSHWRGETDMNSVSIGIELVNPGHEFGYRPFPDAQITALLDLLSDIFTRYKLPPAALLAHSDIAPTRKKDPGELFPWPKLAEHGFGLWFDPVSSIHPQTHHDDSLKPNPSVIPETFSFRPLGDERKWNPEFDLVLKNKSDSGLNFLSPSTKSKRKFPRNDGENVFFENDLPNSLLSDSAHLLRTIGYYCPDGDEAALLAAQQAFLRRYHPERLGLGFDQETLARVQKIATQR